MDIYIIFKILKYADICKCILKLENTPCYDQIYPCGGLFIHNCQIKLCEMCYDECKVCNYAFCNNCDPPTSTHNFRKCNVCSEYICYYCYSIKTTCDDCSI